MPKIDNPSQNGVERNSLSDDEKDIFKLSLTRGFEDTRELDTQVKIQKLMDYKTEIEEAAEIAKAQFDRTFDGMSPGSGNFGIDEIHSGYFGWNSWMNLPEFETDEDGYLEDPVQTWIDGEVPDNLEGSGGVNGPATVGDNAVHIILGVGSHAEDPVISRINWRLNDQPRPAVNTEYAFQETDLQIKWLDTPIVLKKTDDIYAEVYADREGDPAPYFVGFTFIPHKEYRRIDPEQMADNDSDSIVTWL